MNLPVKACLLLTAFSLTALTSFADSVLRFRTPATHFTEALPLGNGRLGVLLFGGPDSEQLVLNETGMWSGSPPGCRPARCRGGAAGDPAPAAGREEPGGGSDG